MKVVNVTLVVTLLNHFYIIFKKEKKCWVLNSIQYIIYFLFRFNEKIRSSIQENSFNTLHETFKLNYSNHDKI